MTLITLNPGETRQIIYAAASQRVLPVTTYMIANLDETGTIYVGPSDAGRQAPDLASSGAASQLAALQSVSVTNDQDWYAYNPSGGIFSNVFSNTFTGAPITVDVIPNCTYWAPSPYQAALSLVDQGLMKDSTGQTINTNVMAVGSNTSDALSTGVPPNVPGMSTASTTFKASGTYTLHTMGANGRIWLASISATFSASAGYGGATDNESVILQTGSGVVLALMELVITDAGSIDSKQSDVNWNGIPIASGDTLQMVVSSSPAMSVIRASGFVAYSSP
jgi:hypothetical protein